MTGLAPEERLAGLAPEELQALLHQLETYLSEAPSQSTSSTEVAVMEQREALIHVLQHKFGELPATVLERIAVTVDRSQINTWLDGAVDADTLADVDFG